MPSAKVHAVVGTATAIGAWIVSERKSGRPVRLEDLVVPAIASFASSLLADLIEPAVNPNHRAFAHSLVVGLLIAAMVLTTLSPKNGEQRERAHSLLICIGSAYLSHLLLDACTPKGLPVC